MVSVNERKKYAFVTWCIVCRLVVGWTCWLTWSIISLMDSQLLVASVSASRYVSLLCLCSHFGCLDCYPGCYHLFSGCCYSFRNVSWGKIRRIIYVPFLYRGSSAREPFWSRGSGSKVKLYHVTWYVDTLTPVNICAICNFWPQLQF